MSSPVQSLFPISLDSLYGRNGLHSALRFFKSRSLPLNNVKCHIQLHNEVIEEEYNRYIYLHLKVKFTFLFIQI